MGHSVGRNDRAFTVDPIGPHRKGRYGAHAVTNLDTNGARSHCVYDPGYVEIRRALKIPVVGFGQSAFHVAVQIAPQFGLIAPNDSLAKSAYNVLDQYGLRDRLVYIDSLNIELPDAHKRQDELRSRSIGIARAAKEHGAGVVIPFGLALVPTHVSTEDIRVGAGVPVLNPAEIGIRQAEVIMKAMQG